MHTWDMNGNFAVTFNNTSISIIKDSNLQLSFHIDQHAAICQTIILRKKLRDSRYRKRIMSTDYAYLYETTLNILFLDGIGTMWKSKDKTKSCRGQSNYLMERTTYSVETSIDLSCSKVCLFFEWLNPCIISSITLTTVSLYKT
mgnify:CR=1 FL=1